MLWLFVSRQPGGSSKHKPEKIVKITREQDANMSRCYCEPAFKHQRQLRDKTCASVRPGCTIEKLHLFLETCDRGERFIQTADKVLKTKGPANPGRCSGSSTHIQTVKLELVCNDTQNTRMDPQAGSSPNTRTGAQILFPSTFLCVRFPLKKSINFS